MQIIKKYDKSIFGVMERKTTEAKLFRQGYVVFSEEDIKEFSGCAGCGLFMLFPPLALLASSKKLKVTYTK